jgi:nitrite reductase (NADH) small subunit
MNAVPPVPAATWIDVCSLDALTIGRGVAALVGGEQIALFLLPDGAVAAIDNLDPFSGASVLARGIVGSVGDVVTVASPIYKQRFDLRSGQCLDDEHVGVAAFSTRVRGDRVEISIG